MATTAEALFWALLETAPDAMVIVDDTGLIRLVNAQAETLFEYVREELLGPPLEVLVPERFRDRYFGNGRVRPVEAGLDLHGMWRGGREFPVEISLSPLQTPDCTLVSAAIRHVTERRAAEGMLARLYEQQPHVALTLQRSLMGLPPDVPGMATASSYFPARQGAGVGGIRPDPARRRPGRHPWSAM
ncbi:PAS domain S-box protein [Streptomyces lavendulae]|uniref:PAS domain S-box protein n=1 Tax=Streptomyces lavendulae TaxID=1914 RepID=UPI003715DC1E